MTILQQKNLRVTSEENLKHWTSVAPTSRQTLEGPIPFVVTTAPLYQISSACVGGREYREPEHSDFPIGPMTYEYFLLTPLPHCPSKPAIRPTHLDWLLQDSTANRTNKIFVNIPLETGYIIPHVSSLKPRSWKEQHRKKRPVQMKPTNMCKLELIAKIHAFVQQLLIERLLYANHLGEKS